MSGTGQYGGVPEVPDTYRAIAELVAGYVDDKLAENNHTTTDILQRIMSHVGQQDSVIAQMQATVGGLRDAVAKLQENAGESMPEHVYRQFVRSEAERLRIVKPVRTHQSPAIDLRRLDPEFRAAQDRESPAPDSTPDTSQ